VAQRASIRAALLYAGMGTIGSVGFVLFARLPDSTADLSPWNHWRLPTVVEEVAAELSQGPVLVTVEYQVVREQEAEFVQAINEYARVRRRDGAYRWGIYRDTESADRYVEVFLVNSWAEHLRQHERQTQSDVALEQRLRSCVASEPKAHHLIHAHSTEA
jgi:hypothetical protein